MTIIAISTCSRMIRLRASHVRYRMSMTDLDEKPSTVNSPNICRLEYSAYHIRPCLREEWTFLISTMQKPDQREVRWIVKCRLLMGLEFNTNTHVVLSDVHNKDE